MMGFMKTMLVSDFKAKCIAVLKEVERTREPVVVTLRGRPMARVEPFTGGPHGKQLGVLKGAMRIRRGLVRIETTRDWEMLK
jgi:prevent-host-death family protein